MEEKLISAFETYYDSMIEATPKFIVASVILITFVFIGLLLRRLIRRRLFNRVQERIMVNFIGRIVFIVMLVIGIILFLKEVGWGQLASGLLAGAGVSAIVIGFAFRDIGENFLAGFFLAFSRPFRTGDIIEMNDLKGIVKSLNFRTTHIRTYDGKDIFLPNGMLIKNPLINYTRDGVLRHDFLVGLDYGDDILLAIEIISEKLKHHKDVLDTPSLKPFVTINEYSTSTINLKIFYWIDHKNYTGFIPNLKTEIMNDIAKHLLAKGFNMPADILELKIYQEGKPIPLDLKSTQKRGTTNSPKC